MLSFKQHSTYQQDLQDGLMEMVMIMDSQTLNEEMLNEVNVKAMFDKSGLAIHKSKGLIHYLKSASIGLAKIMVYAIKKDKEGVKSVMKQVKREDILDFLYKLDLATLHLATGPIHFIDAVTGWDLTVKKVVKDIEDVRQQIKATIQKLKDMIRGSYEPPKESQYIKYLDQIEKEN